MVGLGLLLWIAGWVIHAVPGHSRTAKYLLFLIGSTGFGLIRFGPALGPDWAMPILLSIMWQILVAAAALLYAVWGLGAFRALVSGDSSVCRARRWYRRVMWFQGPDLLSIIGWFGLSFLGVGGAYLILRFCVRARMSQRPFLYLRSFSETEAARVFSSVIMPALDRQGVVSGLVHSKQTSGTLHRDVPVLWRAAFTHISDEQWRTWVQKELERCEGAIVDLSVASQSVHWERETAERILGVDRVLVLSSTPREADDEMAARVAAWASAVLDPAANDSRRAALTTRRHQFSIGLLTIGPALLVGWLVAAHGCSEMVMHAFAQSKVDITRLKAEKYAKEAYPSWAASHPDRECPDQLEDLNEYMNGNDTNDSWGHPFRMMCGSSLPFS